jgi:riboflavin biosynthesis pyrimidine reductase
MGLLRAAADVVLIGAGTLRAHPRSLWTSEQAYPDAASSFKQLRDARGKPPEPSLAVVTASGPIDPEHPALQREAVIMTTKKGADAFDGDAETVILGDGDGIDASALVDALHVRGHRSILCEGGPTLLGDLLSAGRLDELFLTISPRVAGRSAKDERLGLVEGAEFLPKTLQAADLLSARRHGSHLFLRYAMSAPSPA